MMVRFWIDPSGDLFITFTMNGAEQQTTVPMTAGTFVSVEVRQYKVETQVGNIKGISEKYLKTPMVLLQYVFQVKVDNRVFRSDVNTAPEIGTDVQASSRII